MTKLFRSLALCAALIVPAMEASATTFSSPTAGQNLYSASYSGAFFNDAETFSLASSPDESGSPASASQDMAMYATADVAAVPEPETYAMLLAGLGMLMLIIRRRIP